MVLRKMIENLLKFLIKLSFETSPSSSLRACLFKTLVLHQQPLRTIYDILSLTDFILLTVMLFCGVQKMLFLIDDFYFIYHRKQYNSLILPRPLCPT